jgi:hypothetical protein
VKRLKFWDSGVLGLFLSGYCGGIRFKGLGCRVQGLGFRVYGLWFRDLGSRV